MEIIEKPSDILERVLRFLALQVLMMPFGMVVVVEHGGSAPAPWNERQPVANPLGVPLILRHSPYDDLPEVPCFIRMPLPQ